MNDKTFNRGETLFPRKNWRKRKETGIVTSSTQSNDLSEEIKEEFSYILKNKVEMEAHDCASQMGSTLVASGQPKVTEHIIEYKKPKEGLIGGNIGVETSPTKTKIQFDKPNFEDFVLKSSHLAGKKVDSGMREVLINWMKGVCSEINTSRETFHLSVTILDRFLAVSVEADKTNLQLIGTACLLLSNKFQGRVFVPVQTFIQACDGIFSEGDLREMERNVLQSLEFRILSNTLLDSAAVLSSLWDEFVEQEGGKFAKFWSINIYNFSKISKLFYICDMILLNLRYLYFPRNKLALAVIYVTMRKSLIERKTRNTGLSEKEKAQADAIFNRFVKFIGEGNSVECFKRELSFIQPLLEMKFKVKDIGSMSDLLNKNHFQYFNFVMTQRNGDIEASN